MAEIIKFRRVQGERHWYEDINGNESKRGREKGDRDRGREK